MSSVQMTRNFFLNEFIVSDTAVRLGIDNTPNPIITGCIQRQAALMEKVRKLLGNRIILISSGYRGPALNKAIKGSKDSEHLTGEACDFTVPSYGNVHQIAKAIAESDIDFGQLIAEFGSWIHLSQPGRFKREILTASKVDGKTVYTKGLSA